MLGLPVYAWLAGGAALLVSLLYFAKHRTASSAGTATTAAQPGSFPMNIYDSTNIYSSPTAAPGSTAATPAPRPLFGYDPATASSFMQRLFSNEGGKPGTVGPHPVSNGAPAGYQGGAGDSSAALMPATVNPNHWRPRMNSEIFGRGAGGTAPVAPTVVWNMTPTQMYTQS